MAKLPELNTRTDTDPAIIVEDYLAQVQQMLDAAASVREKKKKGRRGERPVAFDEFRGKIRDALVAALKQGQITMDSINTLRGGDKVKPMMIEIALEAAGIHAQRERAGLIMEMHAEKPYQQLLEQLRASGITYDVFEDAILEARLNLGTHTPKVMRAVQTMREDEELKVENGTPTKRGTRKGPKKKTYHSENRG